MVKLSFKIDRGEIPLFSEYLKEKGVKTYEISEFEEENEEINHTDRLKEFLSIPQEFRVNPYEYSPSGDLFFADKRNIDKLNQSIDNSHKNNTNNNHAINVHNLWENIK